VPIDRRAITPMGVEVASGGLLLGRTNVGDSWTTLVVAVPEVSPPARLKRIDLRVDKTWRPALYIAGSADLRDVGVQLGECELER
jgi:hypothetical protein